MANPRYLSREGEPTVELLMKLYQAKKTYFGNLDDFCNKECVLDKNSFKKISKVYLIGSHAENEKWNDNTSDIDFKLVMPQALMHDLLNYKQKVLDKILCSSKRKRDWVDLFFVKEDYQVTEPRWDITSDWNKINLL